MQFNAYLFTIDDHVPLVNVYKIRTLITSSSIKTPNGNPLMGSVPPLKTVPSLSRIVDIVVVIFELLL